MPLVDYLESLELVVFMILPEHGAITAYSFSTGVAVVIEWGVSMMLADFLSLLCLHLLLRLEVVYRCGDLLNEPAVD
jgi:hypothetical protein